MASPVRRRPARLAGLLVTIAALCAAGILLYLDERGTRNTRYLAGDRAAAARVDLAITVQRVDAANDDLILRVLAAPRGSLARPDGTPARDLVIESTSAAIPNLRFPAAQPIVTQSVTASLESSGVLSDYPFDHYSTSLGFAATVAGRHVPMFTSLREVDPFFLTRVDSASTRGDVVSYPIRITRSRATFILAWFMMIAMWALALSVLGGAWVLVTRRSGLVWPALGWMAATLFALVGMRNAAPGSPPVGSLLDYAAFFWAEAIIAVALTYTVIAGVRADRKQMQADAAR